MPPYVYNPFYRTTNYIEDPETDELMLTILAIIQRQAIPTTDRLMHVVKIRGFIRHWDSDKNLKLMRFYMRLDSKPWVFNSRESWITGDIDVMFAVAQLCKQSFRYPFELEPMPPIEREEVIHAFKEKRWLTAGEHEYRDRRARESIVSKDRPAKMRLFRYKV